MSDLRTMISGGLEELYNIWREIGLDESSIRARSNTVQKHFNSLLSNMIKEEKVLKLQLLKSLERSQKQCVKLTRELGVGYVEPASQQTLIKLEHAFRGEARRLQRVKKERMVEVSLLRKTGVELCQRLGLDPEASCCGATTRQMERLREHMRGLQEENFARLERFLVMKEIITRLYRELEEEPTNDFEREVVFGDTERFVLSTSHLTLVGKIVERLEEKKNRNKRMVGEACKKLESLYERLNLDEEKFPLLSKNTRHTPSTIASVHLEVAHFEEIKKETIERCVTVLRKELHKMWDMCFYTPEQRNRFSPLSSTDYTKELLEKHKAKVAKVKEYFNNNQELFHKVAKRQEAWNKMKEVERKAKDPSRLLKARGTSLLVEEKERNKVKKALPRLDRELEQLVRIWEGSHQTKFLVGGVTIKDFMEAQKDEHKKQVEAEKKAREIRKKETVVQERRYGTKPSTPAKLTHQTSAVSITPVKKLVPKPSSPKKLMSLSSFSKNMMATHI